MSHSSYVYLRGDKILLPPYLTRPLNVDPNSLLVGLYYPTPKLIRPTEYRDCKKTHDLIFTPVPYEVWPFSIYITVRLWERRGGVAYFTRWLRDKNINIINTSSFRSGNRHFFFRAYGFFDNLHLRYQEDILNLKGNAKQITKYRKTITNKVHQEAKKLKKLLIEESGKNKSSDERFLYKHEKYLSIEPIDSLTSYFWDTREENMSLFSKKTGWKYPETYLFNEQLDKQGHVSVPERILKLMSQEQEETIVNSKNGNHKKWFWGLAHVDEQNAQIRASLTCENEFDKFQRFEIEYDSEEIGTAAQSTKGLLHACSSVFSEEGYNIISMNSNNWDSNQNSAAGTIHCLAESPESEEGDEDPVEDSDSKEEAVALSEKHAAHTEEDSILTEYEKQKAKQEQKLRAMESKLNKAFSKKWPGTLSVQLKMRPISPYRIFISIGNHSEYRQQILDDLKLKVGPELGLFESDQSFIVIYRSGDLTARLVQDGIQACDGVIQFYEPAKMIKVTEKDNSVTVKREISPWLEVETFAARTLGKPVLYVYVTEEEKGPERRDRAIESLPRTEGKSEPAYYNGEDKEDERQRKLEEALQSLLKQIDTVRGYTH